MPTLQDDTATIADALTRTLHRATALVDADAYDERLRALVRHARSLHAQLQAMMAAADTWQSDEMRAVSEEAGSALAQLEALIADAWPHA
jgi:hypothetical protein